MKISEYIPGKRNSFVAYPDINIRTSSDKLNNSSKLINNTSM